MGGRRNFGDRIIRRFRQGCYSVSVWAWAVQDALAQTREGLGRGRGANPPMYAPPYSS